VTLAGGSTTYSLRTPVASTQTLAAHTQTVGYNDFSQVFSVLPSTPSRLLVLLPGETAAPGTVLGRAGTPSALNAGVTYFATVRLTDDFWNLEASTSVFFPVITMPEVEI